jgi:hypothetical protein
MRILNDNPYDSVYSTSFENELEFEEVLPTVVELEYWAVLEEL